jgi:hypothetical protein
MLATSTVCQFPKIISFAPQIAQNLTQNRIYQTALTNKPLKPESLSGLNCIIPHDRQ